MALIAILSFVGIFAVLASLLAIFGGAGKDNDKKQTLATLDSAIGVPSKKEREAMGSFRKTELASTIPWLNRRLQTLEVMPHLKLFIEQANMTWTPGSLILMSLSSFAAAAYLADLRTRVMLISLAIGVVCGALPAAFVWVKRSRRFGKFEQGLPEALDMMVSALRVGHSFTAAMGLITRECADPVGGEFRIAFEEQNFGLDLRTALDHLTVRVPIQDLKIACTAILIQRESGGNLAEVLEKTAQVIRQRFRLRKQVMVHTAQGRLTGWILTVLPIVLGFLLYLVNPDTTSLLWKREIGVKLLCAGAGMLIVGTLLIQKIVSLDI